MKIGILTWYFGNNYGAKLHSYALQQVLLEEGHQVEMIKFIPPKASFVNIRMNLNSPHIKYHPFILAKCLNRCLNFASWTKRRYAASKKVTNAGEIDALGYDAIIVGSDEVFNYKHPFFSEVYYGLGLKTPLIAYAPSSGQADSSKTFSEEINNSLSKFVAMSARDEHTQQLIYNNTHASVQPVLDPTLLYEYKEIESSFFKNHDPYILIYSFETWDIYQNQIKEYAVKNNLKVVCLGRNCTWADKSYVSAPVEIWLSAFKYAYCVFTDSFHGVVFSIKNQKRFVIVSRNDKINKITDLLSMLEIKKNFYSENRDLNAFFEEPIDYSRVSELLTMKKDESLDYLKSALKGV